MTKKELKQENERLREEIIDLKVKIARLEVRILQEPVRVEIIKREIPTPSYPYWEYPGPNTGDPLPPDPYITICNSPEDEKEKTIFIESIDRPVHLPNLGLFY